MAAEDSETLTLFSMVADAKLVVTSSVADVTETGFVGFVGFGGGADILYKTIKL